MQICLPCFRKAESEQDGEGLKSDSVCSGGNELRGEEDFHARFYCCGRIPPEGLYRKRHGMLENQGLKEDSSIELAVDAFECDKLSLAKILGPSVPYAEDLPEELYQGRAIEVQGKLLENARRFSINLSTGRDNNADLAMHFNPRFDRRVVIRNHRIKNKWGVEEILSLQSFPFTVAVNRIHYCAFAFRIPVEKVKCLIVLGDIVLKAVQHWERTYYPPQNLKKIPKIVIPHPLKLEKFKCDIRRKAKAISVGSKIDIFGRLKLLPRAFYVNLQKGVTLWPHPVIPFHMNFRLYPPGTHKREKEIIFNSWSNGLWGKEEIISFCPFLPGTSFHIRIICKANVFNVLVNEKILFNYQKTTLDSDIDSIVIHGDVVVNKVIIH